MTEIQLFQRLQNSAALTALVANRVRNGPLPEGETLPAITFEYIADTPQNTLNGDTGASRSRYTINAWANTYAQAQELRKAIQAEMSDRPRLALVPLHNHKDRLYRFAIDYSIFNQEG
jgi:hypothetical protein